MSSESPKVCSRRVPVLYVAHLTPLFDEIGGNQCIAWRNFVHGGSIGLCWIQNLREAANFWSLICHCQWHGACLPPYLPPPCFISLGVSQGEFTVPFIVFIVLIGHELDKDGVVFRLWWQRRGGKWKKWNFLGVWLSKNSTLSTTYSGTHTSLEWKIRHFLGQYPSLSP